MANPERGVVEITSEDGTKVYRFRLHYTAIAQLQQKLSTPDRVMPLGEVQALLVSVMKGQEIPLALTLQILLIGFQQFHAHEIQTAFDVERVIDECGGFTGITQQLKAGGVVANSLTPDPEDAERRARNPHRGRSRKKR